MENFDEQAKKLVDGLLIVKEELIRAKDTLAVSIRKDVVAVELKDMLDSCETLEQLKTKLQAYINQLYTINNPDEDKESEDKDGARD